MPVCSQCGRWIAVGDACAVCGTAGAEMTEADARVMQVRRELSDLESTQPLYPIGRAPVALLVALDDDSETEGEVRRLRRTTFTLGRRQGDWTFANDPDISSLHAEIVRSEQEPGKWLWKLMDRDSRNGSFVRVKEILLGQDAELRMGRIGFHWLHRGDSAGQNPQLIQLEPDRHVFEIRRYPQRIGRSGELVDLIVNDVSVNGHHATLTCTDGNWKLVDNQSRNGLWQRLVEFELLDDTDFMLGQQRFCFRLPRTASVDP